MTYAELDAQANRLARHLLAEGAADGAIVGVFLERGPEMLVALLAILKAGAAYVPLDPAFPPARLQAMLDDSGARWVVTAPGPVSLHLASREPSASVRRIDLAADCSAIARQSAEGLARASSPDRLAYVLYTSGSTGRPKGVEITHGAVVNFLLSMRDRPGLASDDVLLAVTTLSFDIAVLEIFLPLVVGARVVIASREESLDGHRLIELLAHEGVTVLQATPASWRLLLDAGWNGLPAQQSMPALNGAAERRRPAVGGNGAAQAPRHSRQSPAQDAMRRRGAAARLGAAAFGHRWRTVEHVWSHGDDGLVRHRANRIGRRCHRDRSTDRQHANPCARRSRRLGPDRSRGRACDWRPGAGARLSRPLRPDPRELRARSV